MPERATAIARWRRAEVDRWTALLARQIHAALQTMGRRVSEADLRRAIAARDVSQLQRLMTGLGEDLRASADLLARVSAAGAVVARAPGVAATLRSRLAVTNPSAVAASGQAARLVTAVTAETRRAIQAVITRAFADQLSPRATAALVRPLMGLTARQATAVVTRRAAWAAAGLPPAVIERRAAAYAAQLLRQRALLIARTEIIRASVAGQQAQWRQRQAAGLLPASARQQWLVTPDDRLCPRCAPMEGRTASLIGAFDGPDGPIPGPPLHPNCRCAVVLATGSLAIGRRRAA